MLIGSFSLGVNVQTIDQANAAETPGKKKPSQTIDWAAPLLAPLTEVKRPRNSSGEARSYRLKAC